MQLIRSLQFADNADVGNRFAKLDIDFDIEPDWEITLNGTDDNGDYVHFQYVAIDNYVNDNDVTIDIDSLGSIVASFTKVIWQVNPLVQTLRLSTEGGGITVWVSEKKLPIGEGINEHGQSVVASNVIRASTRAIVAAISAKADMAVFLTEGDRYGLFVFTTADVSAQVALDTNQAIYLAPSFDPTGKSGAWVRKHEYSFNVRWFGAVGDGATDDTLAIQACINWAAIGGKNVYAPAGTYKHNGLIFKNKVQYRGDGHDTLTALCTIFLYTGVGDGVQINNPINASTAANILIEGIAFKNQNRNAGKGCLADTGSTDLKIKRCGFHGSDRGLILDQTELADIIECDFEAVAAQTCLAWLVNGADRTVGANPQFTNRISFQRNQFNGNATTILVVDDGGACHSFDSNNWNGGLNHGRWGGVLDLTISGSSEGESAAGTAHIFTNLSLLGTAVGASSPVKFIGTAIIPTVGQSCINIISLGQIGFFVPFFGNSAAVKVTGTSNANGIFSIGAISGGGGALFDGMATNHFQIDSTGWNTNLFSISFGQQLLFNDTLGVTYQGYEERIAASPYRFHSITSKGGAGGWAGGYRVRLNFNNGALFDALQLLANTDGVTALAVLTGELNMPEVAVGNVPTPAVGTQTIYLDSADHKLKRIDNSRAVTILN